ncbi:MAG: hypothetical protein R3220_04840 [Balneolaceae bacterium]|nr:hypothetical protein [Balneolaceae bacterium]
MKKFVHFDLLQNEPKEQGCGDGCGRSGLTRYKLAMVHFFFSLNIV